MAGMPEKPRVVSSNVVYAGRLFNVELDEVELTTGVLAKRESIRHPGAVAMVPVEDDGRLLLVTQYRHAARQRLLELPAGTLERGEEPLAAVARELQEEVGMLPGHIEPLGGLFVAPGYTSEYIHLFVCTQLTPATLPGDEDEDIEIEEVTLERALRLIDDGGISDAKSVVGLLRYARSNNR